MANLVKWAGGAGVGLTWTTCFGTELNSLANGSVGVSATVVTNGTALDTFANVSFSVTGTTASTGTPTIDLYLLPLNQDGTTYGDGIASGTTAPRPTYFVGSAAVKLGVTSAALVGMVAGIVIPPVSFKFALVNSTGNTLSASGNTVKYVTYLEQTNG